MAFLSNLGFPGWAAIAAGGALVGAVGLGVVWQAARGPEPVVASPPAAAGDGAAPMPAETSARTPADAPVVRAPGDAPSVPAQAPVAPAVAPPGFDVVRIAEDGGALVAGSALPGAGITLMVDGIDVAQAAADGAGQFVAIFALAPSDSVQLMTLEMVLADGQVIVSPDSVVLTPRPAPAPAGAPAPYLAALAGPAGDTPAPESVTRAAVAPDALPDLPEPGVSGRDALALGAPTPDAPVPEAPAATQPADVLAQPAPLPDAPAATQPIAARPVTAPPAAPPPP
ncbi:MAG: hypothetical protein JJU19_03725, partial [Pararhodobacter sp.]|nr:hypothetical protein [Pararhodobacter sp.]